MDNTWSFQTESQQLSNALDYVFERKTKELAMFLTYYFKGEGAVVENVSLKEKAEINQTKATLKLEFDLIYFNACLNINQKEREILETFVEFDPSTQSIGFIAPDRPERGMDEI